MASGLPPDCVSRFGDTQYRFDFDLYRWVPRDWRDERSIVERQDDEMVDEEK